MDSNRVPFCLAHPQQEWAQGWVVKRGSRCEGAEQDGSRAVAGEPLDGGPQPRRVASGSSLPSAGVPISLVINSTGLQAPGHLDSVELAHRSGRPLLTLPVQPLSNGSAQQLWGGPSFLAPQERFYLKVKGKDHEGNPLLRVSGVSYSGVAPGEWLALRSPSSPAAQSPFSSWTLP